VLKRQNEVALEFAPQIDYFQMVFMPLAAKMGISLDLEIVQRGFYPIGGGIVHLKINHIRCLSPLVLAEFGQLKNVYGRAFVSSSLKKSIAERMASESSALSRGKPHRGLCWNYFSS
jgi:RNA 3'-terminal phosphate cyclase